MPAPGVKVTTAVRTGATSQLRTPSSRFFVVGQAERGPVAGPVLLRGMADYAQAYGARVTYGALYDQLSTYFAEGGVEAYVQRVVGPAAAAGTLTLQDRAATPVNTLKVDAADPGAWSSRLTVQVLDGSINGTFRLVVQLDGVTVEDKTNLASPSAAQVAFASSPYVRVTNLGSATVSPNNNPAVKAATALSAGNDDRASVTTTQYTAGLALFTPGLGDGAVAIPGLGSAVHQALVTHATNNRRVALLSGNQGDNVATLSALAAAVNSEYAGLFGPWVQVTDEAGGFRTISPEGYVAACRARAHETVGPWRAPGGKIAVANALLGLNQVFSADDFAVLDAARVSVIRMVGSSIRLYGWRSLSADESNFKYLNGRDTMNRLVVLGENALEEFVYQPIDVKGQLLSAINASLVGIAESMRRAGGLYPMINDDTREQIDPGYSVDTGPAVNTADSLAGNEVRARLAVRIAPTGALVSLTIVKVGVLAGL